MHEATHQQLFSIGQIMPINEITMPVPEKKAVMSLYLRKKLELFK